MSGPQFNTMLKTPGCSLVELVDVIPPYETMDSETRKLLKRLCLEQLVYTENQQGVQAEASKILVELFNDS